MEWLLDLDTALFLALNGAVIAPWYEAAMRFLSDGNLGRILFLFLTVALIVRDRRQGLWILVGAAVTIALSDQLSSHVIKPWIERARPCNALAPSDVVLLVDRTRSFSFPSSHAANGFAGAHYFSRFAPQARILLFLLAALIAFSRIAVGVHYPLDAVAGAALGLGCAQIVLVVMKRSRVGIRG